MTVLGEPSEKKKCLERTNCIVHHVLEPVQNRIIKKFKQLQNRKTQNTKGTQIILGMAQCFSNFQKLETNEGIPINAEQMWSEKHKPF